MINNIQSFALCLLSSCIQSFSCLSVLLSLWNAAFLGWDQILPRAVIESGRQKHKTQRVLCTRIPDWTCTNKSDAAWEASPSLLLEAVELAGTFLSSLDYLSFSIWLTCHRIHSAASPVLLNTDCIVSLEGLNLCPRKWYLLNCTWYDHQCSTGFCHYFSKSLSLGYHRPPCS